jgi:competence protein ComEC
MTPKAYPYLRLFIPFSAGIASGRLTEHPMAGLGLVLLVGGILGGYLAFHRFEYKNRWIFGAFVFTWFFGAGHFHASQFCERSNPDHFSYAKPFGPWFAGWVYDAPSKGGKLKILLKVEATGAGPDSLIPCTGNLLLLADTTDGPVHYGDRLVVEASAHPAEPPKNPHAFDYSRYLHYQNVHFQSFVKKGALHVVPDRMGSWLWFRAFEFRDRMLLSLRRYFPTREEYSIAEALLLGYQEDLPDEVRQAYAATGSMHALAVSGSHVSMLYAGILFFLARIRLRGKWGKIAEGLIVLGIIWAFTMLTGATASVMRASVMFTVYMTGKVFHRDASAWNVLALSAFILVLFNPYILFDAGFQLSYSAVAGLVFFYPRFYRNGPILPKWADLPWQTLLVGFAAQLGTLPLSLFYFHQFPVYFWLAGWLVVFGGAVFLWGGSALLVLEYLFPKAAFWLGKALYVMLWGMNRLIYLIQHLPGSVIEGIWLDAGDATLLSVGVVAFGALLVYRKGIWLVATLSILLSVGIFRLFRNMDAVNRKEIVAYAVSKKGLIDFCDGNRVFSISDTLTWKQMQFSAQSNRCAWEMVSSVQMHTESDSSFRSDNFLYDPPFIQFFTRRMALVGPKTLLEGRSPIALDVVILTGSPQTSIENLKKHFPCNLVVFDGSNSWKSVEKWKTECVQAEIAFYDIRTQGAWMDEFK